MMGGASCSSPTMTNHSKKPMSNEFQLVLGGLNFVLNNSQSKNQLRPQVIRFEREQGLYLWIFLILDKRNRAHRRDLLRELECLKEVGNHDNILEFMGVVRDEPGTVLLSV